MNPPFAYCVIPRGKHRYTVEGWYREGWIPLVSFTWPRQGKSARIEGGYQLRRMFGR